MGGLAEGAKFILHRAMNRSVVTFHYTLRDPQARLLDTSDGGDPISYLEGAGQIIEGLEEQLRGMEAGAKRNIAVTAAKAYGLRDESQVQRVPRSALPVEGELKVGDRFQAGEDRFAPVVMVVFHNWFVPCAKTTVAALNAMPARIHFFICVFILSIGHRVSIAAHGELHALLRRAQAVP